MNKGNYQPTCVKLKRPWVVRRPANFQFLAWIWRRGIGGCHSLGCKYGCWARNWEGEASVDQRLMATTALTHALSATRPAMGVSGWSAGSFPPRRQIVPPKSRGGDIGHVSLFQWPTAGTQVRTAPEMKRSISNTQKNNFSLVWFWCKKARHWLNRVC